MQTLGFTRFSQLSTKFYGHHDKTEAQQLAQIKETMEAILFKVDNSSESQREKIVSLHKDRIFLCNEGTLTNLQCILAETTLGTQGIDAYVIAHTRGFVTQKAVEMYRTRQFHDCLPRTYNPEGWEIHDISALVNIAGPKYGLKLKTKAEDNYLKKIERGISSNSRKKLAMALERALSTQVAVDSILGNIATDVSSNLPLFISDPGAPNFTTTVNNALETLKLDHILPAQALVNYNQWTETGYKPNVQSIIKDATIIYLNEKGALEIPPQELVLTKLRIELEKGIDENGTSAITKAAIDAAQTQGQLSYALQYAIDNKLKLAIGTDDFHTADPMQYAIDNHIKIDGIDAKQYAVKMVIDEYLKADDKDKPGLEVQYKTLLTEIKKEGPRDASVKSAKRCAFESIIEQYCKADDYTGRQFLQEKYKALQKLGKDHAPKLLTLQSNLGRFLNHPNTPEILANHTDFRGQNSLIPEIDYTKCDLCLIKKCKEVHEKASKARDYDSLSTAQKVAVAFATLIPIVAVIAYCAMKSRNKSEKNRLAEQWGGAVLSDVKAEIETVYPKNQNNHV